MKDHCIIVKDEYNDEVGRIKVGINNDNEIAVIDTNLTWNYEDEDDDENTQF